jgi:nanoRNase/pAp phosphatase (c-di-AMP/oligoRNAs hydrolase)
MSIPETQQALAVIARSSNIALFVPEKPSVDAFSSMMALALALSTNTEKTIYTISPTHVPTELQFLPGSSQVSMKPNAQPTLIIDIANVSSANNIEQFSTKGGMKIQISLPVDTDMSADMVETHIRQLPYDCAILFGASDLADLGTLFNQFADLFYNIPTINIDHKPTNEYFGTINMVDITASSIAEITHELITTLSPDAITQDVATALYAGIVGATESFQKPSTTPLAFQLAAELMSKKAQTDVVIQHLVKTKPLSLLKIAGRTYARLRHDEHGQLFWSILRALDFQESHAKDSDIPLIMHELTNNISGYNAAFILHENEAKDHTMYVTLGKGLSKKRKDIQEQLSAQTQHGMLIVQLPPSSLEEAEMLAIQRIREVLPQFHS